MPAPKLLGSLINLPLSVTEFLYLKDAKILFLCLSDISLFSKMDELFSSITSKSSNDKKSTLIAYKEDNFSFQQLWKKDFSSGVL